eukprot:NODE_4_length_77007_cov_1.156642.p8 type:complete len:578 gc:universal NODE_4_length_77007_cov_1.156642:29913-31646(+)
MGLLSTGTPLEWDQAAKYADFIRRNGIEQLINNYHHQKGKTNDSLKWGDEIESILVRWVEIDGKQTALLSMRGYECYEALLEKELVSIKNGEEIPVLWRPEYGKHMMESLPGKPYGSTIKDLLFVEENMCKRRAVLQSVLRPNEYLLNVTNFPLMGSLTHKWLDADIDMNANDLVGHGGEHVQFSRSLFIPDELINPHPRFRTLTANIRNRRGHKVGINLPIFKDKNTSSPFLENLPRPQGYQHPYDTNEALPDHVYLDCMCFGMGCCCLQLTFQCSNIDEGRRLFDQLAPLAPLVMALSAASPIFKGYLTDRDCRWEVISASVDDRNPFERGNLNSKDSIHIPKSRYGPISTYISNYHDFDDRYNDTELVVDADVFKRLMESGMDYRLSRHFAHLFTRDPLVIYKELLKQDNTKVTDHFENINSTNWQTMRFKPPPDFTSDIGWRVEFRSMEVQPSDFGNAAFSIFIILLTRAIISFNLNFYIPISKNDENLERAHIRDAVNLQKFWFRNQVQNYNDTHEENDSNICMDMNDCCTIEYKKKGFGRFGKLKCTSEFEEELWSEMTLDEIFNGKVYFY